jgi:hypothetical protein
MSEAEVLELAGQTAADVLDSRGRMVVFGAKNRGRLSGTAVSKVPQKKQTVRARVRSSYARKK